MSSSNNAYLPVIYVALPVMDELKLIGACLDAIKKQTYKNYKVFICVNQPENWWDDAEKKIACENNQKTIELLRKESYTLIDKSSQGKGWQHKDAGVGWARKVLMDAISTLANTQDIIISIDADTVFNASYFSSVVQLFSEHPNRIALANPYYHKLTTDEHLNRLMLRYEIYMRVYALNLWHIGSPYAFTALGSAIALPLWAYRKIGGMTPKKSGEDFYFLQKLRKAGRIMTWNSEVVYPAARYSNRVFFGTGPALIKGKTGDWDSYPIYHHTLFNEIKDTFNLFQELYAKDIPTPMDGFFLMQLNETHIWQKLRKNARSCDIFCKSCMQKMDGLRILQFLKWRSAQVNITDEISFIDFMCHFYSNPFAPTKGSFSFKTSPITLLNDIRDFLMTEEKKWQHHDLFE